MQAIILAGGVGSRLLPLTADLPKPMIPLINKPLMEYSVELLKKHGINDIGITVRYLPQYIKAHFSSGEKWNVNILYFEEEKTLGTAGSVKLAEDKLDDSFIVISGDALTNIDLTKILKYHNAINADVTIVLSKQATPLEYGVVLTDQMGRVTSFCEKPQWESVISDTVNTGIYILKKDVLSKIPSNTEFDFSKDLFPILLKENYRIFGYTTEDYWSDLGTHQSYLSACKDILQGKVFDSKYENIIDENVTISEKVKLLPPVYIGKNTIINGECTIGPNVVVGNNCIIENSTVDNCLLWDKVIVDGLGLSQTIIGESTRLQQCIISKNSVIGSNVFIGKNAHIKNGSEIYNNISIKENSIVSGKCTESTIKKADIWNDNGICGIWNHNISSQTLIGIASSYYDEKMIVSSNKTALANSVANLMASYLCLCGSNVYISNSNESSCRFFSCVNQIKGIYIFEKNESILIQFFDKKGLNISHHDEKRIDFEKNSFSTKRGRIIRLNSIDKDFEYFLNASIPFSYENVQIKADEYFKLHNIIWDNTFDGDLTSLASGAIKANNGTITDVYSRDGHLSTFEFLRLKVALTCFLGCKKIFLPVYTPEEIIKEANEYNLKILRVYQHKGDSMQQAEFFNSTEILLEYVPSFFAQAYAFYLSKNSIKKDNNYIISRYDFEIEPEFSCKTIFALNKNKNGNIISGQYKNATITILPHNNGCSFSAYGKFAKEEYSPDILEEYVLTNSNK